MVQKRLYNGTKEKKMGEFFPNFFWREKKFFFHKIEKKALLLNLILFRNESW